MKMIYYYYYLNWRLASFSPILRIPGSVLWHKRAWHINMCCLVFVHHNHRENYEWAESLTQACFSVCSDGKSWVNSTSYELWFDLYRLTAICVQMNAIDYSTNNDEISLIYVYDAVGMFPFVQMDTASDGIGLMYVSADMFPYRHINGHHKKLWHKIDVSLYVAAGMFPYGYKWTLQHVMTWDWCIVVCCCRPLSLRLQMDTRGRSSVAWALQAAMPGVHDQRPLSCALPTQPQPFHRATVHRGTVSETWSCIK